MKKIVFFLFISIALVLVLRPAKQTELIDSVHELQSSVQRPSETVANHEQFVQWIEQNSTKDDEVLSPSMPPLDQLNAQDEAGMTPLLYALDFGQFELAQNLLGLGADPNLSDLRGTTALTISVVGGSLELVESLLESGANPNQNVDLIETTVLMIATLEGQLPIVQTLIKAGANPNHQNQEGMTALMLAADMGEQQVVEYLTQNGAITTIRNNQGLSAQDYAEARGLDSLARILK
jgi:ankyrin repeat protein